MNTDTSKAIDRVRKLLALANSANEHEAANAAARAAEIMERHRLDASMVAQAEARDLDREDEAFAMNDDKADLAERLHIRMPTWYWTIAWGCAVANRCKPRQVYAGLDPEGRTAYGVAFAGRPGDAAAARYMLDALAREVDRLAVAFVEHHRGRAARSAGKSFRLGAASTIADRLMASTNETARAVRGELTAARDEQGLARLDTAIARREADDKRLDAFMASNGVRYRSAGAASVSNAQAFRAGQTAGQAVNLRGGTASLGTGARALPAARR